MHKLSQEIISRRPFEAHLWIIEAPYYHLDRYCLKAGLGPDSAIPLIFRINPDPFDQARLTCPGIKCPRPEAWLKVLAFLHLNYVSFKLYQGSGPEDNPESLSLLKPPVHRELRSILGFVAQNKILELEKFEVLLERAFSLLQKV